LERIKQNFRWRIIGVLFFATTVNYIDRQVMSFVMTDDNFKREMLGVSSNTILTSNLIATFKQQMGLVDAAFKFLYAIGFLFAGWMIDKLGTRKGFSIGIIIWSIAGLLTGWVNSFANLKIVRALLGLGESTNFPSAIKTTAEWFPKHERSFASGTLNAGSNIGVILTALTIPFIIIHYGWRTAFMITGLLGFVLLIVWLITYKKPEQSKKLSAEELQYIKKDDQPTPKQNIPFFKLFRYKQAWIFALGKFFADPIWYFFLTWLPTFFNDNKVFDQNLQLSNFGFTFFIIYAVSDAGSIFFGWLATQFMKRGWSENRARKTTLLICALCVTPIYLASQTHNINFAIALIALATAAHQGWSANMYAIPANLFPSKYVASVTGFGGTIGTISGVILAASTGFIVSKFGYQPMFIIASCSYLVGFIVIHLMMPKLKPVEF
jgi:ACS family hexuronate transporter-like MFS transporter